MTKTKIGIIGCGNISGAYLTAGQKFDILDIAACADLDMERARAKAEEFAVPRVCTVAEMLADADIEIIVNLTIPQAHAEVAMAAINAGKSVYNEKPLAISRADGERMLAAAAAKGVRVGCAPDTFLGGGIQSCRKLIDDGWIGRPVAATAFMTCRGHESWHPDPEFYYKVGGGPMFDMGPYYLTALINLLGSVRRVTGSTQTSFAERTITSEGKFGNKVVVEVPTHVVGVLDFAAGAMGTIITSFDIWHAELPRIEIYGSEGTLSVPDPNGFGGPVRLKRADAAEWSDMPLTHGYTDNYRSIGVADMAYALRSGRNHRASGALAFHVLDIMHAVHDSSRDGRHVELASGVDRPAPLPQNLLPGSLDE